MATNIVLLVTLTGFPAMIQWSERKSRIVRWVSAIVICYLSGIVLANVPGIDLNRSVLSGAAEISVCLSIPLLLFTANFIKWLKHARPALLSFFLSVSAVMLSAVLAFFIFRDHVGQPEAVSGMMIGVYTGGTPNMSAIAIALNVEEEAFILLNSADIIFSGIYFIFLLTFGRHFLGLFLPAYKSGNKQVNTAGWETVETENTNRNLQSILMSVSLALMILLVSVGLSLLIAGRINGPVVILCITTMGILASFNRRVQQLPHVYDTATYLLLVFALAMGAMANFRELISASSWLFYFCGTVVFGSVFLHYLLASFFRIDRDTVMITSVAAIFGPAFVGPVAGKLKNSEVIVSGITLGLLGNAMGNYLGLLVAWLL